MIRLTQAIAIQAAPVLMFTGPELDTDREPCIPGLMLWKTKALEHWQREGVLDNTLGISPKAPAPLIEKYLVDGVLWLPLEIGQKPGICYAEPGLIGLSGHLSFLGPMKLCWAHLAGLSGVQQSRLQQAQGPLPAMG